MAKHRIDNAAICPECEGIVQLSGKLHAGQKISCRRCDSTLMIISRKPLELIKANGRRPRHGRVKVNGLDHEMDWTDEDRWDFVQYPQRRPHAPFDFG